VVEWRLARTLSVSGTNQWPTNPSRKMPEPLVYEFSKHIVALCVRANTNVFKLGEKLGIDPAELLAMINGKVMPTKAASAAWLRNCIRMSGSCRSWLLRSSQGD
jgi:hypothetical protein